MGVGGRARGEGEDGDAGAGVKAAGQCEHSPPATAWRRG